MITGMSTACFFPREYTEDAITKMHEMGVDTIEIFLSSFSEYKPDFIRELKKRVNNLGMKVYSIHSLSLQFEPQLFNKKGTRAKSDADDIFNMLLEAGESLGAQVYVFHGLAQLKRNIKNIMFSTDALAPTIYDLSERSKKYGIKFALENVHWCIYSKPGIAKAFMSIVDSDNLFFTLDIKQAAQSKYNFCEYIDDMGSRIANVHICDVLETPEGFIEAKLPFKGETDFELLKNKLTSVGYNGPVIFEVYGDNYSSYHELKSCYKKMRNLFA